MHKRHLLAAGLAAAFCVNVVATAARASDDPAADLAACHEAVRKRSWKKGRDLYERRFDAHEGSPVLIAERLAIEDDLQLCTFNLGRRDPSGEDLFGPSVVKYSAGTRRIELAFEKGIEDPLWEPTASSMKLLPIRFEDKVEVIAPIEGRKTKIPHRIRMRALLGFSPEEGGGYLMIPAFRMNSGGTDWDAVASAGTTVSHYHRIFRMGGDEPKLLEDDFYWSGTRNDTECKWAKVSQNGEVLKIEVDGCTSIATRDRSHDSGYIALSVGWESGDRGDSPYRDFVSHGHMCPGPTKSSPVGASPHLGR